MNESLLLIDGNQGIYIPKIFSQKFNPQNSQWLWDWENLSEDLSNPDNEGYLDAWDEVLESATATINGIEYQLDQIDGDLWATANK